MGLLLSLVVVVRTWTCLQKYSNSILCLNEDVLFGLLCFYGLLIFYAAYSFQKIPDVRKIWKTSTESTDYSFSIAWLFVLKYLKIMLINNLCYSQMIFVHIRKAFEVIHRQFWLCYRYISCGIKAKYEFVLWQCIGLIRSRWIWVDWLSFSNIFSKDWLVIESGRGFHYFSLSKWVFSVPDSCHAVWIHKLRHLLLKLQMLVGKVTL